MNATEDELRATLARRADRVHSRLTLSDIRDTGLRAHRHRPRLVAPARVAAAVVLVVVVISLVGRGDEHSVPPEAPPPGHTIVVSPGTSTSTPGPTPTLTSTATPLRTTTPTPNSTAGPTSDADAVTTELGTP